MGVKYIDTIERMRWGGKFKSDSAIARMVGITPQALSNCKRKGEIPADLVLKFAKILGFSMDWLISGVGKMCGPNDHGWAYEVIGPRGMAQEGALREVEIATLSHDKFIYLSKLLMILRGTNKSHSIAIKNTIDGFLKISERQIAINSD
jgi:hypothetical protein